MRLLLFIVFSLASGILLGQSEVVYEESGITTLMRQYKAQNAEKKFVKGYRIQVASTTDRVKIQESASEFSNYFPNMRADWINEAPYYKLRAGAFESKLECIHTLKKIQEHFPGAYMVVDNRIPVRQVRGT